MDAQVASIYTMMMSKEPWLPPSSFRIQQAEEILRLHTLVVYLTHRIRRFHAVADENYIRESIGEQTPQRD